MQFQNTFVLYSFLFVITCIFYRTIILKNIFFTETVHKFPKNESFPQDQCPKDILKNSSQVILWHESCVKKSAYFAYNYMYSNDDTRLFTNYRSDHPSQDCLHHVLVTGDAPQQRAARASEARAVV